MTKRLLVLVALLASSVGFAACEAGTETNANMNTNANSNSNMARAEVTPNPTPTPKYSEEQAREERARAKQNKETIGDTLDDAWIHTKIVAQLIGDADTPERKINVDVVNNVVTLRGTVDTPQAKSDAEKIAKETEGVTKVVNELKVAPATKASSAPKATK